MAKHIELERLADDVAELSPREMLEQQQQRLTRLQAAMDITISRERCSRCGGVSTPALAREMASLTRSTAYLSAELRQRDRHEAEQDQHLPDEELDGLLAIVLAEMPAARRDAIVERATADARDDRLLGH